MSTFPGPVKELPGVSVDNFSPDVNSKSGCFFLSHCHTDHMNGLRDRAFITALKTNPQCFLYCSSISKLILGTFPQLIDVMNKIRELKIGLNTVYVPVCGGNIVEYSMTVSCIPAGHCPGSVMFLFQTPLNCVLYTGDFRIAVGDVAKFKQFHYGGSVIAIDIVYLDTTFLNDLYWKFLAREKSIQVIIEMIRNWLDQDEANHVQLDMPAYYGGEHILENVAEEFQCRVHVLPQLFDMYLCVPEMRNIFTKDCADTRIHMKNRSINIDCLVDVKPKNLLIIQPKAVWFKCEKNNDPVEKWECENIVKVNYSSHSSYSELVDFLTYLKPKAIFACTDTINLDKNEQNNIISNLLLCWAVPTFQLMKKEPQKKSQNKKVATKLVIASSYHSVTDEDLDSP